MTPRPSAPQSSPPEELSFEEALSGLEGVVARLESPGISLEEMITAYEEGHRLLGLCEGKLEGARLRVETITRNAAQRKGTGARETDSEPGEQADDLF